MAFLVRYESSRHEKAAYLTQSFYEFLFGRFAIATGLVGCPILGEIALLKYKSPALTFVGSQLQALASELELLQRSEHTHPETDEFLKACLRALAQKRGLLVSGDMHPELDT